MTNNPFHEITIHNRTDRPHEFQILADEGELPDQTPVPLGDGIYKIPMIQPNDDSRHIAFGRFMDQWSKLEMQIGRLLGLAMNTPADEMPVVMNGLGSRGQRECLETLLMPKLNAVGAERLSNALSAFKTNATKRNYLSHGYWHLEVVIADRNGVPWPNYRQYRRYNPSNPDTRKSLDRRSDPKARKTFMFSLARINALSSDLERLWHDFSQVGAADFKKPVNKPIAFNITDGVTSAGFSAKPISD